MIEKTEHGFTGSITDLPPWARDNPELALAGALIVTQDAQLLAVTERQVTKGLGMDEIDKASDATLFGELARLAATSSLSIKANDNKTFTLFTCASQHVNSTDFRTAVKKALVQEMYRSTMPISTRTLHGYAVWVEEHNVPAYLR